MMKRVSSEAEHPWDDLSEPVAKTVRRPRVIRIEYCKGPNGWTALSPDARSIKMTRGSLAELQLDLRARLRAWLSPEIRIKEKVHQPKPRRRARVMHIELIYAPRSLLFELSNKGHSRGSSKAPSGFDKATI